MKRIGILAYEGCWGLNVSLVKDVFRVTTLLETHLGVSETFSAEVLTVTGREVLSCSGFQIIPDKQLDPYTRYDLIVVPAIVGNRLSHLSGEHSLVVDALKKIISSDTQVLSLSTGAYFIAATGMVNGNLLATHWAFAKRLKSFFPDCDFTSHNSYIKEENIYTTGSLNASMDVLLAFIAEEKGERFAYECATHLLVSDPKEIHPILPGYRGHKDEDVYAVQEWIETNYHGSCRIEEMATKFGFSERNLKRRFHMATGVSPNQYLQKVRIAKAKKLLLSTSMSVKEICYQVGYQNDSFFTRAFKNNTGVTPSQWRTSTS